MITLLFSLLITIFSGTNAQSPETTKATTTSQETQTISAFGGSTTWSDVTE